MAGITAAPTSAPAPRGGTLRPQMVRTLLWLRWKLLTRNYLRSRSSIIGAIMLVVVLLPVVGLLTLGLVTAFNALIPIHFDWASNILFYILTGIYLLWALLPLMQFSLNEGLDVTKLNIYPVSQLEMMAGLLISTLLDIPTIGLLIAFIGIGLSWAHSLPQAFLIAVILLVAYVHIVALSQLLLSSLLGMLRSRRWRDLAVVLASLFSLSCYLLSRLFTVNAGSGSLDAFRGFLSFDIGRWLQFLPPGMAARAIVAVQTDQFGTAAIWLAILAVTTIPFLWGWSAILAHSLATPDDAGGGRVVRHRQRGGVAVAIPAVAVAQPQAASTPARSFIPDVVLAIAAKDWRYILRDPTYKRYLISAIYWIVILVFPTVSAGGNYSTYRPTTGFLAFAPIFLVLTLAMNTFGFEGSSISMLALFPVRAVNVFLGKNLPIFGLGLAEGAVLIGLQGFLTKQWSSLALTALALVGMLLVTLGICNIIALFLPARVISRTANRVGGQQMNAGTGFITGLGRVGAYFGVLILALPVEGAIYIPQWIGQPGLTAILLPIAILYCIGMYIGGTAIAAGQYYNRLPEIISTIVKE